MLGRVSVKDIHGSDGKVAIPAGTLLDEQIVHKLEELSVYEIEVRSPITCRTKYGMCSMCYGRDLARGHRINIGEAVGVIAAQSIGEPGTQLTMRTFHIGGAASRATAVNNIQVKTPGKVKHQNLKIVAHSSGNSVVVSRSGQIAVIDNNGQERERYKVPYGATLVVPEGAPVNTGDIIANWDPHTHPIITEATGKVKFVDMVEGVNITRQTDELTGLSHIVITDTKQRSSTGKDLKPVIKLVNSDDEEIFINGTTFPAQYFFTS